MDHRQASELAAMLHARFEPQGWAVTERCGSREYKVCFGYRGSTLWTSSLVDALNWVVWCGR